MNDYDVQIGNLTLRLSSKMTANLLREQLEAGKKILLVTRGNYNISLVEEGQT